MTIDEHIRRQEAGELPEGYPVRIVKAIETCWFPDEPHPIFYEVLIFEEPFCKIPAGLADDDALLDCVETVASIGSEGLYDTAINEYRKERGEKLL